MSKNFFDFEDGDFAYSISDNMEILLILFLTIWR